jgi:energy-converting hydrogenase Eha subunit F
MVNIEMFRHPKYYKELRKLRNKLDQAISDSPESRVRDSVRPGPGPKPQVTSRKPQAPSDKPQAPSSKPQA